MKRAFVALASICLTPLCACAVTYRAEPIEAWVVDAETKQPIEGVVVTANWELETGTLGGNVPAGQLMVMETVTDRKGRFYFPAWGPKDTPATMPNPLKSAPHLVNRDPHILLFKPGYRWVGLENDFSADYNKGEVRKSQWSGKTIPVERFRGTPREYYTHLDLMPLAGLIEDCGWKNIPRLLIAVSRQSDEFRREGVPELYSVDRYIPTDEKKCGSPREFFKAYPR